MKIENHNITPENLKTDLGSSGTGPSGGIIIKLACSDKLNSEGNPQVQYLLNQGRFGVQPAVGGKYKEGETKFSESALRRGHEELGQIFIHEFEKNNLTEYLTNLNIPNDEGIELFSEEK